MAPSDAVETAVHARDWSGVRVAVFGLGAAGLSAIDALHHLGASVTGIDGNTIAAEHEERAEIFRYLGVDLRAGNSTPDDVPLDLDLVIAAGDSSMQADLLGVARERKVRAWSDVELAWQLRGEEPAPWLVVAGRSGLKETAVITETILRSAGVDAIAVNPSRGELLDAVMNAEGPAALVVELPSEHLTLPLTVSPVSAAVLNDPGSLVANPYDNVQVACIYSVRDEATRDLVVAADVVEGARAIGLSAGSPEPSMLGVVEDVVIDRAFVADRHHNAEELFTTDILGSNAGEEIVLLMAAAALTRSVGVPISRVAEGVAAYGQIRD